MSIEKLKETLDEAKWSWVKPHAERDAVILVQLGLDLLEVGTAIAADKASQVQEWVKKGQLTKPTLEQIQKWDESPEKLFLSLVVQPYVLIQEPLHH